MQAHPIISGVNRTCLALGPEAVARAIGSGETTRNDARQGNCADVEEGRFATKNLMRSVCDLRKFTPKQFVLICSKGRSPFESPFCDLEAWCCRSPLDGLHFLNVELDFL